MHRHNYFGLGRVIAASILDSSMFRLSGRISTKTGTPPRSTGISSRDRCIWRHNHLILAEYQQGWQPSPMPQCKNGLKLMAANFWLEPGALHFCKFTIAGKVGVKIACWIYSSSFLWQMACWRIFTSTSTITFYQKQRASNYNKKPKWIIQQERPSS